MALATGAVSGEGGDLCSWQENEYRNRFDKIVQEQVCDGLNPETIAQN